MHSVPGSRVAQTLAVQGLRLFPDFDKSQS